MMVNIENPDEKTLELFKQGFEASANASKNDPNFGAENQMGINFLGFIYTALTNLGIKPESGGQPIQMAIDYDPDKDKERFLRDCWNTRSGQWGFVETPPSYIFTMTTLLKYLRYEPTQELRLLSLGSGVGLYETYLAGLFQSTSSIRAKITCMDYAPGMTRQHEKLIASLTPRPINIRAVSGDMSDTRLPDGCMNSVICNNSLQWCSNWKGAIKEMARVLNPKSKVPYLYLFIQNHDQGMTIRGANGEPIAGLPHVSSEAIMDELEKNNFDIDSTRQVQSSAGAGQHGAIISRLFIRAHYQQNGVETSWREKTVRATGAQFLSQKLEKPV